MFNVRIKKFLNSEQIQIFSEPLLNSDSEREDKRKVIYDTGEIVPRNRRIIHDPFTNEDVIGCYLHEEQENNRRSCRRSKNKIYDIARSNEWKYFFTLTFDPMKVDSYDYDVCTEKLSMWLRNMKRKCKDMRYLVVPEHHESGRWHFHGLFANCEELEFVDSGKKSKGRIIYNVGSYRLGFSTAIVIDDIEKTCSYIAKYITSDLCNLTKGKKRYWNTKNCNLPIVEDKLIMDLSELRNDLEDRASYVKDTKGYVDVTYYEIPIYTTNAHRFVTNE